MNERVYLAIDLKSFFASVECVERGLDPLKTHLVVADASRTEKTICLAVSPSMKAYGIPGRPRLFEVVQKVREINLQRERRAPHRTLNGASFLAEELEKSPELRMDYIIARPRMARYMAVSTRVYQIYLKYVAPEDIHVYSIDEVFMEVTRYLKTYRLTARELAMRMILDVLSETGITATAGIGTNLYLCKVAMDIGAKRIAPDANGVRIAELNELSYRKNLWDHRPLTDFWRVGTGYARKLESVGLHTMGDVARCSLGGPGEYYNENLLYKLFGVNAELLIDHAWGWEPCTIDEIKAYRPGSSSLGSGQVLQCAYPFEKARLVAREMADQLALSLVEKGLVTDQLVLTVGYDVDNLTDPAIRKSYRGPVTTDRYGRAIPKHAHGTEQLERPTSSCRQLMEAVARLFDRVVDARLLVRRMYVVAGRVIREKEANEHLFCEQLDLFTDYAAQEAARRQEETALKRERSLQEAALLLKRKYGRNALFRGMNLEEGATAMERNRQIGGHRA